MTPVWKDSRRLSHYAPELAQALAAADRPVTWVIADDGSGAEEIARLEKVRDEARRIFPHIHLHAAAAHRGKGAVVREAWSGYPRARWLGFVDADGSVTGPDMLRLFAEAEKARNSVIGVRVRTDSTSIHESAWRALRHRGFLLAVRLMLDLETFDTQCGAKVIQGEAFRKVAGRLHEDGFAFDVELLVEMQVAGFSWEEMPVSWEEKEHSRLKPGESWRMLQALRRIQRRILEL
ncbi:hypothetical protein [Haloferula sargassicola]|uniref:hypothetical protein n=1 Tax=Haloferula sargassicola TaxID=490096 RepID=UPI0033655AF8